jgi:hypothetical protein
MLQDSHITRDIFTFQKDFTPYEVLTPNKAGRCSRFSHAKKNSLTIRGPSSLHEELPHKSRPFFTPRRTPTLFEALLHSRKTPSVHEAPNSRTVRLQNASCQYKHYKDNIDGERKAASTQLFFKLFM